MADERNKVGPADPATRRRLLSERLAEREPVRASRYPVTGKAKAPAPDITGVSVESAIRNLKGRRQKIADAVGE